MSDRNNPQAFPDSFYNQDGTGFREEGMTLRDYFAAKALQGLIASDLKFDLDPETLSEFSYNLADDMLKQRNK